MPSYGELPPFSGTDEGMSTAGAGWEATTVLVGGFHGLVDEDVLCSRIDWRGLMDHCPEWDLSK